MLESISVDSIVPMYYISKIWVLLRHNTKQLKALIDYFQNDRQKNL